MSFLKRQSKILLKYGTVAHSCFGPQDGNVSIMYSAASILRPKLTETVNFYNVGPNNFKRICMNLVNHHYRFWGIWIVGSPGPQLAVNVEALGLQQVTKITNRQLLVLLKARF